MCLARKTVTLPNWRPWGFRRIRRRWWRPTARCTEKEEATVYVKELVLFVTVMLGKFCEDHAITYHWTSGQKPQLVKNGKTINCNIANYVPFFVLGLSTSSSNLSSLASSNIFIAGNCDQHGKSSNRKKSNYEWGVTVKPVALNHRNQQKQKTKTTKNYEVFCKSENGCRFGESALTCTARLMNSLAKGLKRMLTKVQWLYWKVHDNWVAYVRIWSRRSLHRFCGWAPRRTTPMTTWPPRPHLPRSTHEPQHVNWCTSDPMCA